MKLNLVLAVFISICILSCRQDTSFEALTILSVEDDLVLDTSFYSNKLLVKKTTYNNQSSLDTLGFQNIDLNINNELEIFKTLDINRPGLAAYYSREIEIGINAQEIRTYVTSDSTKTELVKLEEYIDENHNVTKVTGHLWKKSLLVLKTTSLEISFRDKHLESYEITIHKKQFGRPSLDMHVTGKMINND